MCKLGHLSVFHHNEQHIVEVLSFPVFSVSSFSEISFFIKKVYGIDIHLVECVWFIAEYYLYVV